MELGPLLGKTKQFMDILIHRKIGIGGRTWRPYSGCNCWFLGRGHLGGYFNVPKHNSGISLLLEISEVGGEPGIPTLGAIAGFLAVVTLGFFNVPKLVAFGSLQQLFMSFPTTSSCALSRLWLTHPYL